MSTDKIDKFDPTEGMTSTEKALAGAGKAVCDAFNFLGNKMGLVSDAELAETARLDKALMRTPEGKIGYGGAVVASVAVGVIGGSVAGAAAGARVATIGVGAQDAIAAATLSERAAVYRGLVSKSETFAESLHVVRKALFLEARTGAHQASASEAITTAKLTGAFYGDLAGSGIGAIITGIPVLSGTLNNFESPASEAQPKSSSNNPSRKAPQSP